jgi:hypothetical protein
MTWNAAGAQEGAMTTTTDKPDLAVNIPDLTTKGSALLNSLTASEIGGTAGGSARQYYFGNGDTLKTAG